MCTLNSFDFTQYKSYSVKNNFFYILPRFFISAIYYQLQKQLKNIILQNLHFFQKFMFMKSVC